MMKQVLGEAGSVTDYDSVRKRLLASWSSFPFRVSALARRLGVSCSFYWDDVLSLCFQRDSPLGNICFELRGHGPGLRSELALAREFERPGFGRRQLFQPCASRSTFRQHSNGRFQCQDD